MPRLTPWPTLNPSQLILWMLAGDLRVLFQYFIELKPWTSTHTLIHFRTNLCRTYILLNGRSGCCVSLWGVGLWSLQLVVDVFGCWCFWLLMFLHNIYKMETVLQWEMVLAKRSTLCCIFICIYAFVSLFFEIKCLGHSNTTKNKKNILLEKCGGQRTSRRTTQCNRLLSEHQPLFGPPYTSTWTYFNFVGQFTVQDCWWQEKRQTFRRCFWDRWLIEQAEGNMNAWKSARVDAFNWLNIVSWFLCGWNKLWWN